MRDCFRYRDTAQKCVDAAKVERDERLVAGRLLMDIHRMADYPLGVVPKHYAVTRGSPRQPPIIR
jgi:hypothetical protein